MKPFIKRITKHYPLRSYHTFLYKINYCQQQHRLMRCLVSLQLRRMQRRESINIMCKFNHSILSVRSDAAKILY